MVVASGMSMNAPEMRSVFGPEVLAPVMGPDRLGEGELGRREFADNGCHATMHLCEDSAKRCEKKRKGHGCNQGRLREPPATPMLSLHAAAATTAEREKTPATPMLSLHMVTATTAEQEPARHAEVLPVFLR